MSRSRRGKGVTKNTVCFLFCLLHFTYARVYLQDSIFVFVAIVRVEGEFLSMPTREKSAKEAVVAIPTARSASPVSLTSPASLTSPTESASPAEFASPASAVITKLEYHATVRDMPTDQRPRERCAITARRRFPTQNCSPSSYAPVRHRITCWNWRANCSRNTVA